MKAAFGAVLWLVVLAVGWKAVEAIPREDREAYGRAESELWRSVISSSPQFELSFPASTELRHGDGVFVLEAAELRRVGEVVALWTEAETQVARVRLDAVRSDFVLGADSRVVQRTQRETFEHCVRILITEPQRQEIEARIRAFLDRHQHQLRERFQQVLPGLLEASREFLTAEMRLVLERHGPELQALLEDYRSELTEEHAMPLLIEEVWPIVEDEMGEPARVLGRELWERAPLVDFAWRAAWDRVLSDGHEKVEAAWRDFLEDEAIPVVKDNEELIRETISTILRRVVASEVVRDELREFANGAARDPRILALAGKILEELLIDNPRLATFFRERWTDPELRRQFAAMNAPMQDVLADIGNLLVFDDGDRDRINPDLARVLRLLLLKKDKHYLFLQPGEGPELEDGERLHGRVQS